MPVRRTVPVVVLVVTVVAATFTAINVWAQEPRPSPIPPPADPELFYSGPVIDGPGFCWYRSLGGQRTFAYDHDEDGVAETCSLPRSRREAIARQLAMERLARRQFGRFAQLFDEECQNVAETYGDSAAEATDDCSPYRAGENRPQGSPPLVPPLETNTTLFYSASTITGRDYCINHSFDSPTLYGHDSDGDGVADVCSLYNTKRATVARQWALERLAEVQPGMFDQYFDQECQTVAETYGEPGAESSDACAETRKPKPPPAQIILPVVNNQPPPPPPPPPPTEVATPVEDDDDGGGTVEPPPLVDPTKCTDTRATFDTGTAPQNLEVSGRDGGSLPAANSKVTIEWDPVPGSACYDIWWGAELRDPSEITKGRKYWKLGAHVLVQSVYYPPAGHPSGQKLSVDITQVIANTKYDVKIRAANATTATPWTEEVVGKTADAIGKPEITFMRIESSSSIHVDWTYASAAHAFELQYRKKDTGSWTSAPMCYSSQGDFVSLFYQHVWEEATDAEKDQLRAKFVAIFGSNFDGPAQLVAIRDSRTLTGLDPNTVYEFRVRGVADNDTCSDTSDDAYGDWSDTAKAVTVPSSWITTVTASLDANDAPQFTVTWPAVSGADGYTVKYQDTYLRGTGSWYTHSGTVTTNTVTIDDVECGLQYWVQVRAEFDDLITPWSDEGDATIETEANGCDDS